VSLRKVLHVVGARPNFMKVAPLMAEMARRPQAFEQLLVHTGQHYDENMSGSFFRDLDLPKPDVYLGVGSGTHAEQTARVMLAIEPVIVERCPDLVIVVGDVNSTMAATLVCAKLGVRLAHVEAGLRSFDRSMPEEINRLVTDQLADLLFTTEEDANENLRREGVADEKVHFVGNVMIDSLAKALPIAERSRVIEDLGLSRGTYATVTLHRPSNVDDPRRLGEILSALEEIGGELPIVFPVHPRTRDRITRLQRSSATEAVRLIDPLPYLDFLRLYSQARLVLTDSGGIQEETTYLGIPCLTLRENTERPVTVTLGTNRLIALERHAIVAAAKSVLDDTHRHGQVPPLWDGKAAGRIADVVERLA
jgi:UDP-N-acetylglucosamine 2-epimerase (non-hydrolysing)